MDKYKIRSQLLLHTLQLLLPVPQPLKLLLTVTDVIVLYITKFNLEKLT